MLRRVPQWTDGVRIITATLLERASCHDMEDMSDLTRRLWLEHWSQQHYMNPDDFFDPKCEGSIDDIQFRRWKLDEDAKLCVELLELTAWPGESEHGLVWILQPSGEYVPLGAICDGHITPESKQHAVLARDLQKIRKEYEA